MLSFGGFVLSLTSPVIKSYLMVPLCFILKVLFFSISTVEAYSCSENFSEAEFFIGDASCFRRTFVTMSVPVSRDLSWLIMLLNECFLAILLNSSFAHIA